MVDQERGGAMKTILRMDRGSGSEEDMNHSVNP